MKDYRKVNRSLCVISPRVTASLPMRAQPDSEAKSDVYDFMFSC